MFWDLGDKQLRLDEATSWFIADRDWSGLWHAVSTSEANAGVYYALLKLWLPLGESEFTIRALSAIFGAATVPLVYALGRRLFGPIPAVAAAVLLATNAFFVENVQDARGYALATLLVTASSLLFVDVLQRPRWKQVAAYVALGTLAIYVHFFSALVLAGHLASVALFPRRVVPLRHLVLSYLSIAIATLPLLAFTLVNNVGQIDWIPEPTWPGLARTIVMLAGNASVLAIGYLVAIGVCMVAVARRASGEQGFDRWRYAFVILWAVGPLVVAFGVSFLKPVFIARYLMVSMPALALVAGGALGMLRGRRVLLAGLAVAAAIALSGVALVRWYQDPGIRWTDRLAEIAQAEPTDAGMIFYSPTMLRPYLYYAQRTGVMDRLPELEYPSSYDWPGFSRTRFDPDVDAIAARAAEHDRMWLIVGVAWDEPRQKEFQSLRRALRERCPDVVADYRNPRVIAYASCR